MLTYEITRWPYETAPNAVDHVIVHRADAANKHLRRMVRDMVAANGLLDRQAGVDLIAEVERFEYEAPKPGLYVLDKWRLGKVGGFVEIMIRR